ncbi:putative Glycoprotein membrane GPI-anchored [Quillaja saponaria]|uniref:Glycoprotein membrane GPI-anchored n=1 Tax=Quillaja saponaria TaxID=32244 RepID=A0AAD7Q244_QUISA|nr:putative Glycoprotein membrane GPI-anchored [Quillaja saponaria]
MAASSKLSLFVIVLAHAFFFLSHVVHCNDVEDHLLQGLNSFRTSLNLSGLAKNDKAECLAEEIADQIEDQRCTTTTTTTTSASGSQTQISSYPKPLKKCKVNINTTIDGVVMLVCVPKLVPTLVLTNYTRSPYVRYLNDSRFTGAGIGSEDDWIVVVLSTSTSTGSLSSSADSLVSKLGFGHFLVSVLLGLVLVLVC